MEQPVDILRSFLWLLLALSLSCQNSTIENDRETSAPPENNQTSAEKVPTPFGSFPKEQVHLLEEGGILSINEDGEHLIKSRNRTTKILSLISNPSLLVEPPPSKGLPIEQALLSGARFSRPGQFYKTDVFRTYLQVPAPPETTSDNQLYYYTRLQAATSERPNILQNVLAWNAGYAPGKWSISSWYYSPSGHIFHSPILTGLQPLDEVDSRILKNDNGYKIYTAWEKQTSMLQVHTGYDAFTQTIAALEVANIETCSDLLPGKMNFYEIMLSNLEFGELYGDWNSFGGDPSCQTQLSVSSNEFNTHIAIGKE